MFPLVMLVVNVSSVAVIWFGGHRVDDGQMQVGALTAFLSYLMQILMSVMMATFMLMQIPRSAVCADRISEVLDTRPSVVPPARRCRRARPRTASSTSTDVSFTYPGAEQPVLCDVSFSARPGPDRRDHRLDRRRQVHAGQPGAAALRRDLRHGAGRRRRRPRPRPRAALVADRAGAAEGVPVHRHRPQQPAARQAGRHRRRALAGARGRAGAATSSSGCPRGSTPRSSRAAPTSPAASGSGSRSPGRWCAVPRSTSSTTRSPRSTWPPTPGCARRCAPRPATRPSSWSPSGSPRSATPT